MTEIKFNLDRKRGGSIVIRGMAEALLWVQDQRDTWLQFSNQTNAINAGIDFNGVLKKWSEVYHQIQSLKTSSDSIFLQYDDDNYFITGNSLIFNALIYIYNNMPLPAAQAAATLAGIRREPINWHDTTQAIGALIYNTRLRDEAERVAGDIVTQMLHNADQADMKISQIYERIEMTNAEVGSVLHKSTNLVSNYEKQLEDIQKIVQGNSDLAMQSIFDTKEKFNDLKEEVDGIKYLTKEQTDNWLNSFVEQRKLEKPVTLWEERAENHERSLSPRKWWMVGVGVVGFFASLGFSVLAFRASQSLFRPIVENARKLDVTTSNFETILRYELFFTASVTLALFTMYLWAMRILVRLYTAEHHLAIDARGRSALTETYLSLTKEGAASDADRAIMLSVIFRPVADGLVKEEGPPSISPSSMLSGLLNNNAKS